METRDKSIKHPSLGEGLGGHRPHHYYRCSAESETGLKLRDFVDRCNAAEDKAREWAREQGADGYLESPEGMAGGVAALYFENCMSKAGYERVLVPGGDVYFLPSAESELEKEMFALPVVSEMELIAILGFVQRRNKEGKPMPFTFGDETPVVFHALGHWYVDVPYECENGDLSVVSAMLLNAARANVEHPIKVIHGMEINS